MITNRVQHIRCSEHASGAPQLGFAPTEKDAVERPKRRLHQLRPCVTPSWRNVACAADERAAHFLPHRSTDAGKSIQCCVARSADE